MLTQQEEEEQEQEEEEEEVGSKLGYVKELVN